MLILGFGLTSVQMRRGSRTAEDRRSFHMEKQAVEKGSAPRCRSDFLLLQSRGSPGRPSRARIANARSIEVADLYPCATTKRKRLGGTWAILKNSRRNQPLPARSTRARTAQPKR